MPKAPDDRLVHPRRAVIYARVSTRDQDCARQVRDLTDYAVRAGYTVLEVVTETASGARDDRPHRKRVLALAQSRAIDVVLVTELSRWGRSTVDLLSTLREMEARGVSLVALSGMQMDLTTPHGKLVATLLAGVAEFERGLLRERIHSGLDAARAKGKRLGRVAGTRGRSTQRHAARALALIGEGVSYRETARRVGLSVATVQKLVREDRIGGSACQLAGAGIIIPPTRL